MSLKLHHCREFRSVRSLRLVHEPGLDFERHVIPAGPVLGDPDDPARHPPGRVPCMVDGDLEPIRACRRDRGGEHGRCAP